MKKTAKTQDTPETDRKPVKARLTTAEVSRLREQKRMRRHIITAVIGLGLMIGGLVAYFSPHANANDDIITYELDDSQITDIPEFTDADFAFGSTAGQSEDVLLAESTNEVHPHPDFLSVSQDEADRRANEVSEADIPEDGSYVPGTLLVDMASDSTQEDALNAIADSGCELLTMLSESDGRFGASFSVSVPEGTTLTEARKAFLSNPKVYACNVNFLISTNSVQTEDMFMLDGASDWSDGSESTDTNFTANQLDDFSVFDDPEETYGDLNSDDFSINPDAVNNFVLQQTEDDPSGESTRRWEYRHLNYEGIWNVARSNGRVTVAVIDTGVYGRHRDLQNVLFNPIHVDQQGNITQVAKEDMQDPESHGTSVAGIIGATANNRFGVSGISYNSRIMPIQLDTGANGSMTGTSVRAAFDYISSANTKAKLTAAQKANVRVVNVSLGQPADEARAREWIETLRPAIAKLESSGALVVVAAGNETNQSVPFPSVPSYQGDKGSIPNLLSVINLEADQNDAATGQPHRKATSNYNLPGRRDCEISAPGTRIYSTYTNSDVSFALVDGTSFAAPIVSGTAALMFSANPDLTPAEAKKIICDTATDLGPAGFDDETGYGEINPLAAVERAKSTATIDEGVNIGKSNSSTLKSLKLSINGQSFPVFSYDRIGYDLQYNEMRESIPETAFHFENIPSGLALYRRVSDPEYSDEMINAVNGVTYREVNQVVTFLFAAKNAQLSDNNSLYGIYAFYIKYNLVTGTVGSEAADTEQATATDINEIIKTSETDVSLPACAGMELVSEKTKGVIMSFDSELPYETQYCKVENADVVDGGVKLINLPEGWGYNVTAEDATVAGIALTDDSEEFDAYQRKYVATVSNYMNSYDFPIVLYCESISEVSISSSDGKGAGTSAPATSDPTKASQQTTTPTPSTDSDSFGKASEAPLNSDAELSGMKCQINGKPYNAFRYDKTNYIIFFKVGANLPPAPQLTSIPQGWSIASATSSNIQKNPKTPYGGTKYVIVIKKNVAGQQASRQYDFDYTFSPEGGAKTAAASNGGTAAPEQQQGQQQAPAGAQTVSATPNEVVSTYVETPQQEKNTVEISGFVGQETQEVNAGNNPKQMSSASANTTMPTGNGTGTGNNSDNTGNNGNNGTAPANDTSKDTKPIANTSPLNNFVSGGTLTQTGDAAVIIAGGIIATASAISLALAHRRMRNIA